MIEHSRKIPKVSFKLIEKMHSKINLTILFMSVNNIYNFK